jgi:streptomycin 6-kinase
VNRFAPLGVHLARWQLTPDGEPFETHSSWLCFVRARDKPALLKVYKPESDEAPSARFLSIHKGIGTVRVLESDLHAILLERIVPGTRLETLSLAGRDDEATHIICDIIEKLQSSAADIAGWPGHEDQVAEFKRRMAIAPLTPEIAARAQALFLELEATQEHRVLLHGDLHHENILLNDERGWLAIDPKGVIGDLAYELAAPLRNPLASPDTFMSPKQMDRRVSIYCERLKLDRRRVLGWCFARNCIAALWYADRTPEPLRAKVWPAATLTALKLLDE